MEARRWLCVVFIGGAGVAFGEEPALLPATEPPKLAPTPRESVEASVGQPLPALDDEPEQAESDRSADERPPAPGDLATPPWLLPPDVSPAELDLASAFDLNTIVINRPEGEQAAGAVFVSDVHQASAEAAIRDPRLASLLTSVEKLAEEARTIGDVTDIIEQCGATDERFPCTANQRALAPVASWAFNRRGELRAEEGDDRTAYDDFARAIEIDPTNALAHHNRGLTLAEYGRLQAALADFNRALSLNPSLVVAYGNRGELHLALGANHEAEADFSKAIAGSPDAPGYYAGRAAARRGLGRAAEAVRDLNQAILLDPMQAPAYAERGALYAQQGYYEQAVADFDTALQADPHCVAAYQSLAWLLSTCPEPRFRDREKALEASRRAIRLGDAGDPILLDTVAAAHAAAGLTGEAARLEQQAILVAPPELRVRFEARLALYREGRPYRQPKQR